MNSIVHFDSGVTANDSIERYMTPFERTLARQRMQEALLLLNLARRVTGRLRAIPAAIREALSLARAQRLDCDRHGAAKVG